MEILHFKNLGDTESVFTNAVVLVLGECQWKRTSGGIYPHTKLYWNVMGIDNTMSL